MATIARDPVRTKTGFYFWMALFMLACVVVGFGSSLATGKYNDVVVPLPGYIVLHGMVLLAWFAWLAVQTGLVRSGNTALHRKTGIAGAVIALLVVVVSPPVFLGGPRRLMARGLDWTSDMSGFPALGISGTTMEQFTSTIVFTGFANLVNFVLLIGAALWLRGKPELHKRLMLLGSIAIFAPALARIARWPGMGGEGGPILPLMVLAMLLVPVVHDRLATGRFQKVTLAGMGLIIAVQLGFRMIAQSDAGHAFVRNLA